MKDLNFAGLRTVATSGPAPLFATVSGAHLYSLPTPAGGTRLFQPRRPVTPEVRETIRRAAQLALAQRDRTPEQIIQDGAAVLERTHQDAALNGQAITEDSEAAQAET